LILKELRDKCKELGIKGSSKMSKEGLINAINKKENEIAEINDYIKFALKNGEKKYKIERGCAIHVDGCPINARLYNGKSYANITDDCIGCEYLLAVSENLGNYNYPEQYIVCGGRNGIKKKFDRVEIKFKDNNI
jgi:uncharacterized secreted protein with C-terminal beta-propeller domain